MCAKCNVSYGYVCGSVDNFFGCDTMNLKSINNEL